LFAPFAFASLRRVAALALVFSMAAEIERDLISKRTIEALRFKKAQGMTLGRPKGIGKRGCNP
jgi:DNA invertase Pin-like site-specific DNA recombinase